MGTNFEAVLCDFEGTLVDFQWQLASAVNEVLFMLREVGFPTDSLRSRKYSTLLAEAVKKADAHGITAEWVAEQINEIYDRYDRDALTRWSLRPSVENFLRLLKDKGIRAGLISNVGGEALAKALIKLGLAGMFEVALSRNDVPNLKPSPDGINLALRKMGVNRDSCLFLGDSLDDIHAARQAGLTVWILADGENPQQEILEAEPDRLLSGYEELLELMA